MLSSGFGTAFHVIVGIELRKDVVTGHIQSGAFSSSLTFSPGYRERFFAVSSTHHLNGVISWALIRLDVWNGIHRVMTSDLAKRLLHKPDSCLRLHLGVWATTLNAQLIAFPALMVVQRPDIAIHRGQAVAGINRDSGSHFADPTFLVQRRAGHIAAINTIDQAAAVISDHLSNAGSKPLMQRSIIQLAQQIRTNKQGGHDLRQFREVDLFRHGLLSVFMSRFDGKSISRSRPSATAQLLCDGFP